MSNAIGNGEKLRRATALWHGYLAATGNRFELAQFLQDATHQKQILAKALAHGDQKLAGLAREWLIGTGHPMVAQAAPRGTPIHDAAAPAEASKAARYLKGVR